jgi:hypothetical protein
VKGLTLYKTGPLGIMAQPPSVTLLGSGENTVVGQFPARASSGPVAARCSESGKIQLDIAPTNLGAEEHKQIEKSNKAVAAAAE